MASQRVAAANLKSRPCSEDFPKHFDLTTYVNEGPYPEYRRRPPIHGGQVATKMVNGEPFDYDN